MRVRAHSASLPPPNFEKPTDEGANNTYEVIVQASDTQATDTQTITVTVTNQQASITSDGGGETASVSMAENSTGVTTVRAAAGEPSSTLGYSLAGGIDASLFTINPTTGALTFITAPNFEAPTDANADNVYEVLVQVSDGLGGSDQQALSVTVSNGNDAPRGGVSINGTAAQGRTLTAGNDLTDADGPNPLVVSYQWRVGSTDIPGATGSSLVLDESHVGQTIACVASYTDALGNVTQIISSATAAVANVNDAPTGSVTLSGTPTVGQTLTASHDLSDADGPSPLLVSYQWQAGSVDIPGATGTTLQLTAAHMGQPVTCVVRYTDAFGRTEQVSSAATSAWWTTTTAHPTASSPT